MAGGPVNLIGEKNMSYSARIDKIEIIGEAVSVERTEGHGALPAAPSGVVTTFNTKQEFVAALEEAEVRVAADLWLIRCAKAYKADPAMKTTFQTVAKASPEAVIDLTGLPAVLQE